MLGSILITLLHLLPTLLALSLALVTPDNEYQVGTPVEVRWNRGDYGEHPFSVRALPTGSGMTCFDSGPYPERSVSANAGMVGSVSFNFPKTGSYYFDFHLNQSVPVKLETVFVTRNFQIRAAAAAPPPTSDPTDNLASKTSPIPTTASIPSSDGSLSLTASSTPASGANTVSTASQSVSSQSGHDQLAPSDHQPTESPSQALVTHSKSHVGAIVGGVVGGLAALCLVALLVFCLVRSRRRRHDLNEHHKAMLIPFPNTSSFGNSSEAPSLRQWGDRGEQPRTKAELIQYNESPSVPSGGHDVGDLAERVEELRQRLWYLESPPPPTYVSEPSQL